MKITIDRTRCTALGVCESFAPDVFEVNDDGDLEIHEDGITPERTTAIATAVQSCPTAALRLVED